ncbi:MAG: spherulation-specific family 4 protein [Phormidesmis sp.]
MKKFISNSLITLAIFTPVGCQASTDSPLEILIPLYIYPSHYDWQTYVWPNVAAAQAQVSVTAIINPNNGPDGGAPNQDYVEGMRTLTAANVQLLGYVSTRYGDRPLADVKADIDLYAAFYPVSGIFLDEAASGIDKLGYYQALYRHIQTYSGLQKTILNQGTSPDPAYLTQATGDTFVVFENQADAWRNHLFPAYMADANAQQFAAMVHTTNGTEEMRNIAAQAKDNNIGYIFITDDRIDGADQNPWNQLPAYWTEEIEAIRDMNLGQSSP